MSLTIPIMGVRASTAAAGIDLLFWFITAITVLFSAGIFAAIVFYAVRYRRGTQVDRSNPPQYNSIVELVWTIIPLVIVIGIFFWSSGLWLANARIPSNALEIYVVGKQWMWKAQHPEGRWENNTLHVPLGRPVVLTMTSEDVIHAFYVPAFRLKKDVLPGEYTQLAFTPTKTGEFHLFCAEFCGTEHSKMRGTVTVMRPAEYEKWLREGSVSRSLAAEGKQLFISKGCNGCHGANSSVRAPRLEGVYGKPVPIQIPRAGVPLEKIEATTIIADTKYIHDSIVLPEKQVRGGFNPIMPTFKNRITEEEILKIVAYIKSLSDQTPTDNTSRTPTTTLGADDYRSRTGFVPTNIKGLK